MKTVWLRFALNVPEFGVWDSVEDLAKIALITEWDEFGNPPDVRFAQIVNELEMLPLGHVAIICGRRIGKVKWPEED